MNKIKSWLVNYIESARKTRTKEIERELSQEGRNAIQVTEFDGKLYLCHCGTPLVDLTPYADNWVKILNEAREVRIKYLLTKK